MPPKKAPPDKRKRDQGQETFSETVVKCCLKKHLREQGLLPVIRDWVTHVSKLCHRGSLIVNHFLLYCLENHLDIPKFSLTFFRQCFLLGGSDFRKETPHLLEFYDQHRHRYPEFGERIAGDQFAIKYAAGKYETNFATYLAVTFKSRQKAFVSKWGEEHGLDKDSCFALLCTINNWTAKVLDNPSDEVREFIAQQKELLGLGKARMSPEWLKRAPNLLRCQFQMLQFFEARNMRTFSLAPIMGIRNHFITIDSGALFSMMKGLVQCDRDAFYKDRDVHFRRVFKIKAKKGKFTCLVETDGISVCFHFRAPKSDGVPAAAPPADARVIAIDPGRVNMIFGVEEMSDGKFKTHRLTRKQYRHKSHIQRNDEKIERWNTAVQAELAQLSLVTPKTASLAKFNEFLRVHLQVHEALWDQFGKHKYGLLRMDNYIHKTKAVDKFLNSLVDPADRRPVVIAYGAAKISPTGRGEVSVPTTSLAHKCMKKFCTVLVDEFRTSKCCRRCKEELCVLKREADGAAREIRGLRCCRSSNCRKTHYLVSRDLNAALNILDCYVAGENRPGHLRRKCGEEASARKRARGAKIRRLGDCDPLQVAAIRDSTGQDRSA